MENNNTQIYKTSEKQRDAVKKYKLANKDKVNAQFRESHKEKIKDPEYVVKRRNYAKKSYEKIKDIKTDVDFVIAFIDE